MSIMQARGGIPRTFRYAADATGRMFQFPFFTSYLVVRSSDVVKLYWTEEDYNNDTNYVQIAAPAAADPASGQWFGPVDHDRIWIACPALGTATVEVTMFQRRG